LEAAAAAGPPADGVLAAACACFVSCIMRCWTAAAEGRKNHTYAAPAREAAAPTKKGTR
jgi:hypothetical protein